jgi:signal transduction histidine kinase
MSTTAGRSHGEVPGWVYTVLVAAGQAVAVGLIIAIGSRNGSDQDFVAYLFAGGFGAVLLLRNRFPVIVLLSSVLAVFVYYSADYPPIGMAVPVVGACYSAAERGRVLVACLTGAVLLGVSLYFRLGDGESSAVLAYDLLTNAALIGCAIALALTVRSRRELRSQTDKIVALEREHQQERAARLLEEQRLQIARDVHDSIGHALSLVSVQARVAQQALGTDDTAAAHALGHVVDATTSSLADLRRTLAVLQPDRDATGHVPLNVSGIERTAQSARDAGLDVAVVIDVDPATLPAATAGTVFRIIQESVTNVLRHAKAKSVSITLRAQGDELHLRIADDGQSADLRQGGARRGIDGMRERAALLGGRLTTDPSASGFTVKAILPIRGSR